MADLPTPISRQDKYLKNIAEGTATDLPEPISRQDIYLNAIANNLANGGTSGGGSGSETPSVTVEDTLDSTSTTNALSANQGRVLNSKIPTTTVKKIGADGMNNGLGVWYNNGNYERVMLSAIPDVGGAVKKVAINENNQLQVQKVDNTFITTDLPFIVNVEKGENGELILSRANGNKITITFAGGVVESVTETQPVLNIATYNIYTIDNNGELTPNPEGTL